MLKKVNLHKTYPSQCNSLEPIQASPSALEQSCSLAAQIGHAQPLRAEEEVEEFGYPSGSAVNGPHGENCDDHGAGEAKYGDPAYHWEPQPLQSSGSCSAQEEMVELLTQHQANN